MEIAAAFGTRTRALVREARRFLARATTWTIYGLLRTADSVTPSLTGFDVLLSLLLYVAVYLIIYPTGVVMESPQV